MKKSLILIFVVLMALFVSSLVLAQEPAAVSTVETGEVVSAETAEVTTEAPTEASTATAEVTEAPTEVTEAPTEAPAVTAEVTEAPTEVTDTPTEAPATAEVTEAPTEVTDTPTEAAADPEVTEAPTDAPATPEVTDTPMEASAAPEVTDTTTDTPATPEVTDTPAEEITDTPDPVDTPTDAPAATGTPAATDETPKSKVTFTITGKQETIEEDGEPHTAEGYTVEVSCANLDECPYTASDVKFIGESLPKAELTEAGKAWMGLDAEQFTSEIEDVDIIEIIVVDGYLEITAKPVVIEETAEPTEEITAEPTEEITAEPTAEEPTVVVPEHEPEVRTSMLVIYLEPKQTVEPTETAEVTETVTEEPTETAEPTETTTEEPTETAEVTETVTEEPTETAEPTETVTEEPTETAEATETVTEETTETVEPTETVTEETTETAEPTETADDGFQTISSDGTAVPTAETEPTAEVTETPAAETTLTLSAESVIFTGADETTEALLTTEGDTEVTVLSVDEETGWALVELADGTQGYIQMPPAEEAEETPEAETTAEPEKIDETPKSILFTADMVIYTGADAESEALSFTTEEELELTILSVDENGWALVELPDGTQGYVQMPQEEAEEEPEETEDTPKSILFTADMVIYTAADAGSEALGFTTEEELELTILSIDENGWALVELPDGTQGYVQMPVEAVEETEEPEETDDTPKSILLTEDMVIYTGADAESETLAFTFEEGIKLTILSLDPETGWALVALPDGTQGYILMPKEEAEEEPVIATVVASTDIRVAANGMSAIFLTPEDDMEVTILGQEGDWVKVQLEDGTIGYIYVNDIEFEGKQPKVYEDKKVTIFSDHRKIMLIGEPIHLTSLLEGFEDCIKVEYQWECDKGNGFEPVENGTGDSYTYEASLESMTWSWQLIVYYK